MELLKNVLLAFLPQHYLRRWCQADSPELARATALGGFLQMGVCFGLFLAGFFNYIGVAGIGKLAWLEYTFTPQAILSGYFGLEGLVRVLSGLVSGEAMGTLPLYLIGLVDKALSERRAEEALGERIPDRVERGDGKEYELKISSCRPKLTWDHLLTIAYEDGLFEVARQEQLKPPRRFVYYLRRIPEHKIVRGLHRYDPTEPLLEKPK